MASITNWVRYMAHKLEYSLTLSLKKHTREKLSDRELLSIVLKNLLYGRITYLHNSNKGQEMAPTMGTTENTLLVRKLPVVDTRHRKKRGHLGLTLEFSIGNHNRETRIEMDGIDLVGTNKCINSDEPIENVNSVFQRFVVSKHQYVFIGDAVVLKDPNETNKYIVRRLAALEGSEMVSSDEKDEPFVLEKDQCWVVAENQEMKSKEAYDSRTFGPISMADIVGRAIYCLRTAVDHGPVSNSEFAMEEDSPILAVELDVDEMAKDHKA